MEPWVKFLEMKKIKTIIDLTGGAGGESLWFAEMPEIERVTSYEIDKKRYDMFVNNIKKLREKDQKKVHLHFKDSTTSFGDEADLILFDPPWTFHEDEDYMQGKRKQFDEYMAHIHEQYEKTKEIGNVSRRNPLKSVNLKLGKYDVQEVINRCKFKTLALKIPLNCIQSPYSNDYKPVE